MTTLIHERVAMARRGENPWLVCEAPSGWIVMGDVQPVAGYALVLPDPVMASLNNLDEMARAAFLADMTRLGDALLDVTGCARINYDILGNSEPALHAHVFARYDDEPEGYRTGPAFFYDWTQAPAFGAEHEWLRTGLCEHLAQ